jgi:hypothetical protein
MSVMPLVNWVKKNKLTTFLLILTAYFLYRTFFGTSLLYLNGPSSSNTTYGESFGSADMVAPSSGTTARSGIALPKFGGYTPQADISDRMVIQESNLSLLVKDVVDTRNKILGFTKENGGYMVNASTSNPQDAPTANITIRIPSDKLQASLDFFHSLSIKVVSENLIGTDVTDQYVDIDTRIAQLEKTRNKFESILESATKISDITDLTQQILSYQNQIDSYKGQQDSLKKNAELAKLTIYLSTDEMALPYAPSETFRPNVIFKLAVRSLVGSLRNLATKTIWIGVYSVIWVPALIIFFVVRKWWKKRSVITK